MVTWFPQLDKPNGLAITTRIRITDPLPSALFLHGRFAVDLATDLATNFQLMRFVTGDFASGADDNTKEKALCGIELTKAGLSGFDKARANQIVEEISKGMFIMARTDSLEEYILGGNSKVPYTL